MPHSKYKIKGKGNKTLKIFRVFASEDALTIILISAFLLVMSGVFNLLEKTGGTKIVIGRVMRRLADKGGPVVCLCVLIFMVFGSFFGMFEELVTLLPLIIMFMLSMKLDTMTGLGACLLAACFGFSAAITNPFSVGLAASIADVPVSSGLWLRLIFFVIMIFKKHPLTQFILPLLLHEIAKTYIAVTYESEPRTPILQAGSLSAEPPGKPKNTGVGSMSLLQQIFLTQELNQGLLH